MTFDGATARNDEIGETAFEAAAKRAGLKTDKERTHDLAQSILREVGFDEYYSVKKLRTIAREDTGILSTIIAFYLDHVAREMGGSDLSGRAIVQQDSNQGLPARQPNDDEEGQRPIADLAAECVPTSSSPVRGKKGQAFTDAQTTFAPAAKPKSKPAAAKRGADAIASVQSTVRKTLLDTWKVLDGRVIGDITFGELDKLSFVSRKEAEVFKRIKDHATNVDPSAKVRDVIKTEVLEKMAAEAEEAARAA